MRKKNEVSACGRGTQINRQEPLCSSDPAWEARDCQCHSDTFSRYSTTSRGQREVCARPGGCTEEVTVNFTFYMCACVP